MGSTPNQERWHAVRSGWLLTLAPLTLHAGPEIDTLVSDPTSGDAENYSVEFCGGTHVQNSRDIGDFAIISEEAIAKGIRRVVCVSGHAASEAIALADAIDKEIAAGVTDLSAMLSKVCQRVLKRRVLKSAW